MKYIGAWFVLIWLCWNSSQLHASFKEACGPDFKMGTVATTTAEIDQTICQLNLNGSEAAIKLTEEIAKILRDTPENKPMAVADFSSEFKSRLKPAIDSLMTTLNQVNIDSNSAPSNELEQLLYKLIRDFGTIEERRQHFEQYKASLLDTLAQTEIGKQVRDCFMESHPNVTKISIRSSESFAGNTGISRFMLERDPQQKGKYIKSLLVDVNTDPLNMIDLFLHEMKHGCTIDEKIALDLEKQDLASEQQNLDKNNADQMANFRKKIKTYNKKEGQYNILDELYAYQAQSQLREELTQKAPQIFCKWLISGMMWGYALNTYAQSGALMKDMINEGTYATHLIDIYTRLKVYHKEDLYVQNKDGSFQRDANGSLIFLPELRQKIEEAGFKLK